MTPKLERGTGRHSALPMSTFFDSIWRGRTAPFTRFGTTRPLLATGPQAAPARVGQALLGMPFDALRFQYANAVLAGWVPRSMLASARSERAIDLLEKFSLGPIARRR